MKCSTLPRWILIILWMSLPIVAHAQPDDPRQKHYNKSVRPILIKHCFGCHNGEDNKAGINFDDFYFISSVVRRGELFTEIIQQMEHRTMPPDTRPPLSQSEVDTATFYLNSYLQAALAEKDPGVIPPRRLNNQEYKYAIKDLLDVEVNVDSLFPADPAGGAGFDNQARTLYISPIMIERYFESAESIIDRLYEDQTAWRARVPRYRRRFGDGLRNLWFRWIYGKDVSGEFPQKQAEEVLFPFATLAYRNFLGNAEKERLIHFFQVAWAQFEGHADRYDASIRETMKLILISHNFLYRVEEDPDIQGAYRINDFELASRLSFFLWSSVPDEHLLNVAYRENLHDINVLKREVKRMLKDPKAKRLGSQFALQWLELSKLKDPNFEVDTEMYPGFSPTLKDLMLAEVERYFNHVFLDRKDILELIDSDYSFLNEELAKHYGVSGVEGENLQKVHFASSDRGGMLGTGAVLTATSLPTRTSPVLRGKWVLEKILGTPPPPPPPNVPELEADHDANRSELSLRTLLERHRADPACSACHQAMDPIGLGLENFDAIGRWRTRYGETLIDASGITKSGKAFEGPGELRKILLGQKELFAKTFSYHMLSFALGRSIKFKDSPTVENLQKTLMQSGFNSDIFIFELVNSYPFRYKKSDTKDVPRKPKKS